MSRHSLVHQALAAPAAKALQALGTDLRVARRRRRMSLREMAERMGVSIPTVQRMEAGEPTVAIGIHISALWVLGLHGRVAILADPSTDQAGLSAELARLPHSKQPSDDDFDF